MITYIPIRKGEGYIYIHICYNDYFLFVIFLPLYEMSKQTVEEEKNKKS